MWHHRPSKCPWHFDSTSNSQRFECHGENQSFGSLDAGISTDFYHSSHLSINLTNPNRLMSKKSTNLNLRILLLSNGLKAFLSSSIPDLQLHPLSWARDEKSKENSMSRSSIHQSRHSICNIYIYTHNILCIYIYIHNILYIYIYIYIQPVNVNFSHSRASIFDKMIIFSSMIRNEYHPPQSPRASHPKHLRLVINAWNKTKKKNTTNRKCTVFLVKNHATTATRVPKLVPGWPNVVNLSVFTMSSTNLRTKAVFPTPSSRDLSKNRLLADCFAYKNGLIFFQNTSHASGQNAMPS